MNTKESAFLQLNGQLNHWLWWGLIEAYFKGAAEQIHT